jgi:hypothetical protein
MAETELEPRSSWLGTFPEKILKAVCTPCHCSSVDGFHLAIDIQEALLADR